MQEIIAPCMVLLVLANLATGQKSSPCPDVFKYKPRGNELDRWYGITSLTSPEDLTGVWLRIQLDQPAALLGNWFGEVTSTDNKQFDIINKKYKLRAGNTTEILFFVKEKKDSPIPSVTKILLNGKSICTPQRKIEENTLSISSGPNTNSSSGADEDDGSDSESEFFVGDFANIRRRKQPSAIQPSETTTRNPRCGIAAFRATAHGQDTTPGQWPWHSALSRAGKHPDEYFCSGTLITQEHVLTAAHCVTKPKTKIAVGPSKILVHLGKYDKNAFDPESQTRGVSKIFVHQDYNAMVYFNDIAVLKLSEPVEITNFVRTCCLWEEEEPENIIRKEGTVVGWGFTENGDLPSKLKQAQMAVVSTWPTCISSNKKFYGTVTFENNFCAGFRNDTSVCNDDSGNGMVFPKKGTSGQNTVWQIRGLVSLGAAFLPLGEQICNTSQYRIFTDVAKYTPWIRQVLSQ